MDALAQVGITIGVTIIALLTLRAALWGGDKLPGMPKVKYCPRCGAGGEAIDIAQQGNVRRRQVLPFVIYFTGFMTAIGLMIFGFLNMWSGQNLAFGALLFFPGLYLGAWSIKYMHRRPIVECYACGWKAGMRA